ncbi:hypothetical protein JG688_00001008, partial [Phytophthora aleatoria]
YCETKRNQLPSSCYANLISHLKDKHQVYIEDNKASQRRQAGSLSAHGFVISTAVNMYHWMEWVVARNMPLCEVDGPLTRAMSKLKPICSKTLKVHLSATVTTVEKKIAAEMTDAGPFGIMFDGWSCNLEHYVALFAVFWYGGERKQVINDERLSANERKAVRRFEKTTATSAAGTKRKEREDDVEQGGKKKKKEDFASSILKEKKKSTTQATASLYSKLLFKLPPTGS